MFTKTNKSFFVKNSVKAMMKVNICLK